MQIIFSMYFYEHPPVVKFSFSFIFFTNFIQFYIHDLCPQTSLFDYN